MIKKTFTFLTTLAIFVALSSPLNASRHHQGHIKTKKADTQAQVEKSSEKTLTRIKDAYVIHFVLDGTNAETFESARKKGLLPNISKMFFDSGAVFEKGLSLFPSTSTTVYQSYATGLLPGRSGIPHLQRMDRDTLEVIDDMTISGNRMMNSDLINKLALVNPASGNLGEKTSIFELLEGHPSAAIYSSFHRGASYVYPKVPIKALWSAYVSGNIEKVDDLALRRVMKIFSNGDETEIPRYTLVGLYSSDIMGHHFGPKSPEVEGVLARFDLFLAQFNELLEKRGIKEKTYIVVTADHGMHESGRLFKLQKELETKGVHFKPRSPKDKKFIMFAADRGVVSTHIYVRRDGGFEPLTDPETLRNVPSIYGGNLDLIKSLLNLEATEFVIVRRGDGNSRVFSKDGKAADIDCFRIGHSDYCSYEFDRSLGDPFNYSSNPELSHLLDGRPHSSSEWMHATADEMYPDAIISSSLIFEDGRGGDIYLTTSDGYGFRKVKAGNHGGLSSEDMRVPAMISGPGVPKGKFGTMRQVDLYPLLIEWFGLAVDKGNYDGRNPLEKRTAESAETAKLAEMEKIFSNNPPIFKIVDMDHFVRNQIAPKIPTSSFGMLMPAARKELKVRSGRLAAVQSYVKKLEMIKADPEGHPDFDQRYLEDHIKITERTFRRTLKELQRIEDIIKILESCKNPSSYECSAI